MKKEIPQWTIINEINVCSQQKNTGLGDQLWFYSQWKSLRCMAPEEEHKRPTHRGDWKPAWWSLWCCSDRRLYSIVDKSNKHTAWGAAHSHSLPPPGLAAWKSPGHFTRHKTYWVKIIFKYALTAIFKKRLFLLRSVHVAWIDTNASHRCIRSLQHDFQIWKKYKEVLFNTFTPRKTFYCGHALL